MERPTAAVSIIALGLGCGRIEFDRTIRLIDAKEFFDARPADMIPDLLVWYPLDDAAFAGFAVDASGNNRAGLCQVDMTCPEPIAGKIGGAAAFNNTSTRLRTPHDPGLDLTGGFTVAAWTRAEGFSQFHSIASKPLGNDTNNSWQLELPGILQMRLKVATGATTSANLNGPATLDMWTHVAGSWDGAAARLYLGGMLVAETAVSGVPWDASDVLIGADENQGGETGFWDGRLDDVRIYSRALDAQEVMWLATP